MHSRGAAIETMTKNKWYARPFLALYAIQAYKRHEVLDVRQIASGST